VRRLLVAAAALLALAPAARAAERPPIAADASFSPLVHAFADPVTAEVTLAVDARRVDPGSVRLRPSFAPYEAAPPQVERRDAGDGLVVLHYAYPLRCTAAACVPRAQERSFTLRAATVRWSWRWGGEGSAQLTWPRLTVASRLSPRDLAAPALTARVDPPAVDYSLPPGPLGIVLLALGPALAAGGIAALALVLRPRRRVSAAPPLEQALDMVERAAAGEVVERRRALHRLALALEDARLEPESYAAKKLAWAPAAPDPDGMRELTLVIRGQLGEAA